MRISILLVPVILALCFLSCKDNSITPLSDTLDGFPLAVGSRWAYAIYDSVKNQSDTVNVTIDKRVLSSSSSTAYLWRYQYRTSADSLYVVRSGDTVFYYPTNNLQYPSIMFVFPLEVGRGWLRPSPDTFYVEVKESISVPAGTMANSSRIYQQPFIGNFYGGTTYWVAPEVGIVQKKERWFDTISWERKNTTWQLLSYSSPH